MRHHGEIPGKETLEWFSKKKKKSTHKQGKIDMTGRIKPVLRVVFL